MNSARLVTFGFYGDASPPAVAIPLDPGAARTVSGLELIRDSDGRVLKTRFKTRRVYTPGDANKQAGYRALIGQATQLVDLPSPFGSAIPGVLFSGGAVDSKSLYESTIFQVTKNGAWCLRAFLETPAKAQTSRIWTLRWANYQFQLVDGQERVMRLSGAWTQAQENTRQTLLAIENRTEAEDTQLQTLEALIYRDFQDVDLGGEDYFYGAKGFELSFLCDPSGVLCIEAGNKKRVEVENSDAKKLVSEGKEALFWPATPVTIGGNGGIYLWQLGSVSQTGSGRLEWLERTDGSNIVAGEATDYTTVLGAVTYHKNAVIPAGASITFATEGPGEGVPADYFKIVATFVGQAWLYGAARAYCEAGVRDGDTTLSWDSDDHPGIVVDVQVQEDTSRRRVATITLRDMDAASVINQASGMPLYHLHALENRVATLELDGEPWITGGLIIKAEPKNMAAMFDGSVVPASRNAKASTQVVLTLCDSFARFDEIKIDAQPIGDGRFVGAHARSLIRQAGKSNAEMAGIPADGLGKIRAASPGEPWREQPAFGATLTSALDDLKTRYGLGAIPYERADGVLCFERPSTTIKAAFHTLPSLHVPTTAAGRLAILAPLDWSRDFLEFFNDWLLIGKGGISARFRAGESKTNFAVLQFLGRLKPADFVQDDALGSLGDLERATRTRRELEYLPGHFASAETYFHKWLRTFDVVTVDDTLCRVESIGGGTTKADRMQLLLRRLPI